MPTLAEAGDKKLSSRVHMLAGVPEADCLGSPSTRETALAGARRPAGVVSRACGFETRLWGFYLPNWSRKNLNARANTSSYNRPSGSVRRSPSTKAAVAEVTVLPGL